MRIGRPAHPLGARRDGPLHPVPPIIRALGGPSGVVINASEFGRMFVLHVRADGAESLLTMRYGA